MYRTALIRHGPWLAAVGLVLLAVALPDANLAEDAAEGIAADEHGAASTEVQARLLATLVPEQDVGQAPAPLDPIIWAAFLPEDNAQTAERVALGRKLYFDKRLSADGTVSCATCHDVTRGFTDQRAVSEGIDNQLGKRNAPTTLNVALLQTLFLDGRSPSLEHQAGMPPLNPVEMGMASEADVVAAIRDEAEYQAAFQEAYGREVNYEDIRRAIAAFERTLVFMDSPFRRFVAGQPEAISSEAAAGWELYNGRGRCASCHPMNPSNPLGTDNRFHNVGVSARHQDFEALARQAQKLLAEDPSEQKLDELAVGTDLSELGRFMVTRNRADTGSFRTPLILNIALTPPYMHDGSMATLWDVIDHYNKGGEPNPFLDGGIEPLALTEDEIDQLVAFLFTLTDDRFAEENRRQLERQRAAAEKERPFRDEEMAERRVLGFERRVMGEPNTEK